MKAKYVPGFRKGRLTVTGRSGQKLLVRCDCGTEKAMFTSNFARPCVVGCGCAQREWACGENADRLRQQAAAMAAAHDLTGERFGRLVVLGFAYTNEHRVRHWNVKCACGEKRVVQGGPLKSGVVLSCGCHKSDNMKRRQAAYRALTYPGVPREEIKRAYAESERGRATHKRASQNYLPVRRAMLGDAVVSCEDWEKLCAAYDYSCAYCCKPVAAPHQDHVLALKLGGKHEINNIVPACRSCNSKKWKFPLGKALERLGVDRDAFWAKRDRIASAMTQEAA